MILVNGERTDRVCADDRGFQYGDGLFETIAVGNGRVLCLDEHLERLSNGCSRLLIPFRDESLIRREIGEVVAGQDRCVVKVIVTRGTGGRGYAPPAKPVPMRFVGSYPWPTYSERNHREGIEAIVCTVRLGRNPFLAGLKHLARLEQVLGRRECDARGCAEGLMLDSQGFVVEGTASNLFVLLGGQVLTPKLDQCGVAGVMRAVILEHFRARLPRRVRESRLRLADIMNADEVFFCNSLAGVWPVRVLDGKNLGVGPTSRALQQELVGAGMVVVP